MSIFHPCGICSLRVKTNSVQCAKCSKCVRVRMVISKLSGVLACVKCGQNVGYVWEYI